MDKVPQKLVIFRKLYYSDVVLKKTKQYFVNLALQTAVYSGERCAGKVLSNLTNRLDSPLPSDLMTSLTAPTNGKLHPQYGLQT